MPTNEPSRTASSNRSSATASRSPPSRPSSCTAACTCARSRSARNPGRPRRGPPPTFVMKLLTPAPPRATPTRQDGGASLRRATLAPRGRSVVRPRPRRAGREEPCDPRRRRRVTRRRSDLDRHVERALSHFETSARRNLATHGGDLIPSGDLARSLRGLGHRRQRRCRPAGGQFARHRRDRRRCCVRLRQRGDARASHATSLATVDDVRSLDGDAHAAVDAWLELHQWRTVTSDDLDRPTLAEVPALQLSALLHAGEELDVAEPDIAAVRSRVPAEHRATLRRTRRRSPLRSSPA